MSKQRKFTKEQLEAIEKLEYDIDELDNKPCRLFSSLRNFADSFADGDEETRDCSIESINELENLSYLLLSLPQMSEDIIRAGMTINKEESSGIDHDLSRDYQNGYENGIKKATKLYCKKMLDILSDTLFE
jgi:hypothetical protein